MKKRLFIAVTIPDEHPIIDSINVMKKGLLDAPIRWVEPEKLHLTFCFLGNVLEPDILKIKPILQRVSSEMSKFSVIFNQIGAFPDLSKPKVIWFGFNHSQTLVDLVQKLRMELAELNLPLESDQFQAHLTIGRTTSPITDLIERIKKFHIRPVGTIAVDHLELFESKLSKEGSRYISLAKYSF